MLSQAGESRLSIVEVKVAEKATSASSAFDSLITNDIACLLIDVSILSPLPLPLDTFAPGPPRRLLSLPPVLS